MAFYQIDCCPSQSLCLFICKKGTKLCHRLSAVGTMQRNWVSVKCLSSGLVHCRCPENEVFWWEGPQGCWFAGQKFFPLYSVSGRNQSQTSLSNEREVCCSCNVVTASGIAVSRCPEFSKSFSFPLCTLEVSGGQTWPHCSWHLPLQLCERRAPQSK